MVALHIAQGQGKEAMRAAIFESAEPTGGLAVEDNGLAAHRARERSVLDIVVPGDGIPVVTQEHFSTPFEFLHFTI
jgi:hypothetical protein